MKDARVEFTGTERGFFIPPHSDPIVWEPKTRADCANMLACLNAMVMHVNLLRAKLPDSSDETSERPSVNQVVELVGVSFAGQVGRIG